MSELTALKGNAVIGQSGGPTAVINQSAVGVVEGLRANGFEGKIYGAKHAVDGMMSGDFIDLTDTPQDVLDRLAETPSSGLGSSRHKPNRDDVAKMVEVFKQNDIRYFFYIGGNDSSDACRIVSEIATDMGYEMHAFHVPKTVDNDLVCNDHTPGWGSAAKFVAQAFQGDNLDNKALPGVKINVIMGRHAGFLTAAAALARQNDNDGPHLIYVPEADFDANAFCADIQKVYDAKGRCIVAVSEGIHDADGTPMAQKLAEELGGEVERDAHGNVQLSGSGALADFLSKLVKEKTSITRVRADTFGYLQRAFTGCVSEVDQKEARAAAHKAAELACSGMRTGSIAIQRIEGAADYQVEYNRVELRDIAAKTRHLPQEWIVNGNDVSDAFIAYAKPIVGDLPHVEQVF